MATPHPALMAIRYAVRQVLDQCSGSVLVACSGGADSLALAVAALAEGQWSGHPVGAVVIDHGLQPDSADVAARAAGQLRDLGLDPVQVQRVVVDPGATGIEDAARIARYAALDEAADRLGTETILLGHTRDDQAEQVLLGLIRGSGARSLSGIPPRRGRYARPLLTITRSQTRAACAEAGLTPWDDPMNEDPTYARVRARRAVADLERDLGPGVAAALARTAGQLRVDADHLDLLADEAAKRLAGQADSLPLSVDRAALHELPEAVRGRVWRRLLIAAGAPAGSLSATHTSACDRLLTHWTGQGPIVVPGALAVSRAGDRVTVTPLPRVE